MIAGYIVRHWRGQHGILWSTIVNGLLAYLAVVFALLGAAAALRGSGTVGGLAVMSGLAAFAVVMVWSLVGICRSAFRTIRAPETGIALKAVAIAALVLVVVVVVAILNDVRFLLGVG